MTMRIALYSDLHREFDDNAALLDGAPLGVGADLVILAGDTDVGSRGVEWAVERFGSTPVLYVLGNHEFYGQPSVGSTIRACRRAARGSKVSVLHRDRMEYGGMRFLGCTLWTDYRLGAFDEAGRRLAMRRAEREMSDTKMIVDRPGAPFVADAAAQRHATDLAWLRAELRQARSDGVSTVVVTHHAPTPRLIGARHAGKAINGGYATDLEAMCDGAKAPALWCAGHTHAAGTHRIWRTLVVSNPCGYVHRGEATHFDPSGQIPAESWLPQPPHVEESLDATYARLFG